MISCIQHILIFKATYSLKQVTNGFRDWVLSKWKKFQNAHGIDKWQKISSKFRSSLRGWNGNWGSDLKKRKQDLLLCIMKLDQKNEDKGLVESKWEQRYIWENELIEIYSQEELMWQSRGGD